MIVKRGTKTPFLLFFISYLLYFMIIWNILFDVSFYTIRRIQGMEWDFGMYFLEALSSKSWIEYIAIPMVFAPYVYYFQCFSMVNTIEIDEKDKSLKILYLSFFFWNKVEVYSLEDQDFWCTLDSSKKNIFTKLFLPHCDTTLCFGLMFDGDNNKSRTHIILRDRCGWKKDQLQELYDALEKYNHLNNSGSDVC